MSSQVFTVEILWFTSFVQVRRRQPLFLLQGHKCSLNTLPPYQVPTGPAFPAMPSYGTGWLHWQQGAFIPPGQLSSVRWRTSRSMRPFQVCVDFLRGPRKQALLCTCPSCLVPWPWVKGHLFASLWRLTIGVAQELLHNRTGLGHNIRKSLRYYSIFRKFHGPGRSGKWWFVVRMPLFLQDSVVSPSISVPEVLLLVQLDRALWEGVGLFREKAVWTLTLPQLLIHHGTLKGRYMSSGHSRVGVLQRTWCTLTFSTCSQGSSDHNFWYLGRGWGWYHF